MSKIVNIADTPDPDLIRDLSVRLNAAFVIELRQIKIGLA